MSNLNKILFLSNQLPHNFDAGGILYSNIINKYGVEKFSFISLVHPIKIKDFNIKSKRIINQYSLKIPRTNIFFKILSKLPFIETFYTYFNLLRFRKKITYSIIKENFNAIYAPLRGEVLLILPYILKKTNLPLYAMVEDTVEAEINDPYFIYTQKKKNYYKLLSSVKSLAVAGETMSDYFKETYNIKSIIHRQSFDQFSNVVSKQIDNKINVFFAGNTYAKNELLNFIKGLEIFSQKSKFSVTFYLAAHGKYYSKSESLKVINLGWISQSKLQEYMNISHIAYLPYKFEVKFKHQMTFAFPGKGGFYISNNLPVFFHGPSYSSFNQFLSDYPVGLCCDSLDPEIICLKFNEMVESNTRLLNFQKNCLKAFKEKFSKQIFSNNVLLYFNK